MELFVSFHTGGYASGANLKDMKSLLRHHVDDQRRAGDLVIITGGSPEMLDYMRELAGQHPGAIEFALADEAQA